MVALQSPPAGIPHNFESAAPQKAAVSSDVLGWLTREESAHLLGVAVQTIKNYERRGVLHLQHATRRDVRGRVQVVVVHDPKALTKLRETIRGKRDEVPNDTKSWLTRNESTDLLSVCTQTLKNYERQGKLHPIRVPRRDARGHEQLVVVYDPKELAKLPRGSGRPFGPREPGELNARANELFAQGKNVSEVVIELRETSDKVRELHDRWLDDSKATLVISNEAKGALENMLGPFTGVAELVELVTAKLAVK